TPEACLDQCAWPRANACVTHSLAIADQVCQGHPSPEADRPWAKRGRSVHLTLIQFPSTGRRDVTYQCILIPMARLRLQLPCKLELPTSWTSQVQFDPPW